MAKIKGFSKLLQMVHTVTTGVQPLKRWS